MSLFGGPSGAGNVSQPPDSTPKPLGNVLDPLNDDKNSKKRKITIESPPAKRVRYHLSDTFIIIVGIEPNKQQFTAHHNLITKRSDFFRVARLARWTKPNKATKLVDEDPDTFAAYLDRLYFGAGSVIKSSDADATRDSSSAAEKDEQKKTDEQEKKDKQEKKDIVTVNFLLDVYLLADRLLDPTTANVVIDEIIAFVDTLSWAPGQHFIARVYDSTLEGNPLRRLCRDWRVHEIPGWASRFPKAEWSLPHEYLQDLLIEIDHLQDRYYHRSIREIFEGRASSRPKGHYYQKVEQK